MKRVNVNVIMHLACGDAGFQSVRVWRADNPDANYTTHMMD